MSRLIFLARAIIISGIIADCVVVGITAYRWSAFSEAPSAETWSSLIALTAAIAVTFALFRVHDIFKE